MMKTYACIAASTLVLALCGCSSAEEGGPGTTGSNDDDQDGTQSDAESITLSSSATLPSGTSPTSGSDTNGETDDTSASTSGEADTDDPSLTAGPDTDGTTGPTDSGSSSGDATDGSSSSGTSDVDTIYDIQDGTIPEGTVVTVDDAIVTAVAPTGLFVQAAAGGENSGIFIFSGDGGPDISGAALGDELLVTGSVFEFSSLTEIVVTDGSFEITASPGVANVPAPATITAAEIAEPWEAVLIRVAMDTFTITEIGSGANADEFTVEDGTAATAIVDDFIFNALNDAGFLDIGVGATFTSIQGPLNGFNGLKIAPRSAADLMGYAAP